MAAHWDVLNAFFQGDTSPAEELVDREVRTVSDKDYTLTVESSVSDGETAYLVARVEARNEAAVAVLHTEDFFNMDTLSSVRWRTPATLFQRIIFPSISLMTTASTPACLWKCT